MLRSELTKLLEQRRDNDVVVDVDGIRVPIVGASYCHTADQIVLALDEEHLKIALAGEEQCRRCGCTESQACPGGCFWATDDEQRDRGFDPMTGALCTACAGIRR